MRFCSSIFHRLALIGILTLSTCPPALSQRKQAQLMDEDFAKSVKEWTTRPEFISPLVDHLPKVEGVPSPKDVLGYHIGTPKKLTRTAEIYRYYRELASRSPRVKVINIGQTDEGRECLVVIVADEETVKNIDAYRGYLVQLSDPRQITEAQAQEIIAKAKPIYHLMGGLHSSETGPPEMLMELTYRLAVEDSPIINAIRDNVIVTITPVAEPDGRDRYVDWYYRHKIDETGEQDSMGGPPYWGKYIYHDNNRDINYSQVTMRNLLEWYLQWRPPIMHDLHESVPFLYTFSGQAPQQPALDPILYGELPWFSNFEMAQMIKYGMPGVWTHGFVDMWSPGYLAFMSSNHNGLVRMYETFGNGGANTMKRRIAPPSQPGGAGQASRDQTSREWYRPSPPYKEVEWSMRNNANFMQTGVLSALQLTSQFPKVVLENFYKKSRNSIEDGKTNAPYGFIIPTQANMTGAQFIVNTLRLQGIEVGRLTGEIKLKEGSFPAGSFVIKRDQPYGRLAKILLEKQIFPDQNLRTYDDTGWTMGLMANVTVVEIADKAILSAPAAPVGRLEIKGEMKDRQGAAAYAIVNYGSNNLITLRFRLKDLKVQANELSFKSGGEEIPAGSLIVAANQPDAHNRVKTAVESLGLKAIALTSMPAAPAHEVDLPRLAVYSTWGNTQEVGWVRHAFDKFEINYDLIYKERVKQGNLRDAYDVIVIPNQGRSGKGLVFDRAPVRKPLAYVKSDEFKSHG
ncbi:MAG TPA: M14 family zinc carboxypeptidase, partial [Blastocatellia bacterium]